MSGSWTLLSHGVLRVGKEADARQGGRHGRPYDPLVPALLAAGLTGLLVLASAVGSWVLLGGVVLTMAVLLTGAVQAVRVPVAEPAAALALVAGALAAVLAVIDDDAPDLGVLAPVIGLGLLGGLGLELARRRGRDQLTASLTFTVTALVLAGLLVTWVVLRAAPHGAVSVGIALAGVGVVALAEALPGSRPIWRLVGIIAAAGVGAVLASMQVVKDAAPPVNVMVLAALTALLATAAGAVVDRMELEAVATPGRRARRGQSRPVVRRSRPAPIDGSLALRVALPLAMSAPAAYVLGRVLVG